MKIKLDVETGKFQRWVNRYLEGVKRDAVPTAIRHISLDLLKRIIEKNPVDTGRSRAAWYPYLESRGAVFSEAGRDAHVIKEGRSRGGFKERFDILQPYVEIRNGVRYIKFLEYGSSGRSPYGMVRVSMAELRGRATRAFLDQLKKESIIYERLS
jgi:hypothetical protein